MSYPKQTSIDRPTCPLGHGNLTPAKTWKMKGKGGKTLENTHWKCEDCGYATRTYRTIEGEKE